MDKKCLVCDKMYIAKRADSKFCSSACRKAYSRQVNEDPKVVPSKTVVPKEVSDNEWFNSAETKTQAEIEEHYTLKNFPCNIVYTISGRGTSRSPYPRSDKRSLAYYDI